MSVLAIGLLRPDEVAEALGVHVKTVMRAINAGDLRASQLARRGCWRIRPEAVEEWIEARANRVRERPAPPAVTPIRPAELRGTGSANRTRRNATPGTLHVPPKRKDAAA